MFSSPPRQGGCYAQTDRQTQTHVPSELSSSSSSAQGTRSTRSDPPPAGGREDADTSCPHSVGQGGGSGPSQDLLGNCSALSSLLPAAQGSGEHLHSLGSRDKRLHPMGQGQRDIAQDTAREGQESLCALGRQHSVTIVTPAASHRAQSATKPPLSCCVCPLPSGPARRAQLHPHPAAAPGGAEPEPLPHPIPALKPALILLTAAPACPLLSLSSSAPRAELSTSPFHLSTGLFWADPRPKGTPEPGMSGSEASRRVKSQSWAQGWGGEG